MKTLKKAYEKTVKKYGDVPLTCSLHHVGDDDTKHNIEEDLKELLDKDTMRIVRAVFGYYTEGL
jgi:7-keto-8-aminopelargonate synthetase-like enzyme